MSSPNDDSPPLYYEPQLSQQQLPASSVMSSQQQTPIYTSMSSHSADMPIVSVAACCNCDGDYRSCDCLACDHKLNIEQVMPMDHNSHLDEQNQLFAYALPPPQIPSAYEKSNHGDDIIHVATLKEGTDPREIRRQKMSEAARIRYHSMTTEEKKALNDRRILLRKRRQQKDREMEELERILRASNDITDDLIPVDDPAELAERRNRANASRSRYQTMTPEQRKDYNLKRRLRQLGISEDAPDVDPEKIKNQIAEVNARKAEAARARYHRMSPPERKVYNRRRTESFRRRRMEEERLLATPAGQISAEDLEKAQNIMLRNAKRAEQARLRYQRKQMEKSGGTGGPVTRKPRKARKDSEENNNDTEPNLDSILDSIEREVTRRTQEAKNALQRMNIKKEEEQMAATVVYEPEQFVSGAQIVQGQLVQNVATQSMSTQQNIVQYVQVPANSMQNGFIMADNKFVQLQCDPQSSHAYTLDQSGQKFEGGYQINPISIIHYDPQHPPEHHHQLPQQLQRIEIVQPTILQGHLPADAQQRPQQIVHYTSQPQGQQYVIQMPAHSTSALSTATTSADGHMQNIIMDDKSMVARAKRAERARRRYHEMSAEARHEFNAKRAQALKSARLRDEDLCRQGDEFDQKGIEPDDALRVAIEQARQRRAKRAEAARLKYQRMTHEQRKAHNAMRDAQRRQRKREMELDVTVE